MFAKVLSLKSLFAAGVLATAFAAALPAPAAQADVSVGIGLGFYPPVSAGWSGGYEGGYGGGYGSGYGGGYDGGWHRPPVYDRYVSCRDGRRILWRSGYSGIEVQSCRGGFYRYTAWRNGKHYLVAVDQRGDVNRLRRIY